VDSLDKAKEMATKVGATFPIGYGLKVLEDADKVGAYRKRRWQLMHATNSIIDSDQKVTQARYSISPIGRIVAECVTLDPRAKKRKTHGS
jgi:DNA phosphorothioation-dependent restriction protein DptG